MLIGFLLMGYLDTARFVELLYIDTPLKLPRRAALVIDDEVRD